MFNDAEFTQYLDYALKFKWLFTGHALLHSKKDKRLLYHVPVLTNSFALVVQMLTTLMGLRFKHISIKNHSI